MPSKRAILEQLKWDELALIAEQCGVAVEDWRSAAALVEALAHSRKATARYAGSTRRCGACCMKSDLDLAKSLAVKASNDLRMAEIGVAHDAPLDTIAFHLQQTAEKLLKALLSVRGVDFPRTHEPISINSSAASPLLGRTAKCGPPIADSLNPAGTGVRGRNIRISERSVTRRRPRRTARHTRTD